MKDKKQERKNGIKKDTQSIQSWDFSWHKGIAMNLRNSWNAGMLKVITIQMQLKIVK